MTLSTCIGAQNGRFYKMSNPPKLLPSKNNQLHVHAYSICICTCVHVHHIHWVMGTCTVHVLTCKEAPPHQQLLHKQDHSHRPPAPHPPHILDHIYAHSLHHHHQSYRERGRERGAVLNMWKWGEEKRERVCEREWLILHFKSIYFFIKWWNPFLKSRKQLITYSQQSSSQTCTIVPYMLD